MNIVAVNFSSQIQVEKKCSTTRDFLILSTTSTLLLMCWNLTLFILGAWPQHTQDGSQFWNATASSRWNSAHGLLVISSQPWSCSVHIIPWSPAALSCFCTRFAAWLPRPWTSCTLGSQEPCDCAILGSLLLPPLQYYQKYGPGTHVQTHASGPHWT